MRFFSWLADLLKPKADAAANTNIIAGEVTAFDKHPNADRLRVVSLNVGDRIVEPVVCGASNFSVGDRVVLALPGAIITHNLHDPENKSFVLGKAKIRGVESQGMICSGFELGLRNKPEEKPEILILKPDVMPGTPFSADMVQ